MYEYTIANGEYTIDTSGFCNNMQEVKKELISQTPEYIHMKTTYPNGFIFESITYADKIIFRTNRKLIDNGNHSFTVLDK